MFLDELMEHKKMSKYRLSKNSGVPYTTINDLCNGKTRIEKCSAETLYRISKELNVSMESILEPYLSEPRVSFDIFKSNTCHNLKEKGDIQFVIELLEDDPINRYYRKRWYVEAFYLLGMLDYVSRINGIPQCTKYDNLRSMKLEKPVFSSGVLTAARITKDDTLLKKSMEEAIPEFIRFNIVENEVRDVI